MFRSGSSRDPQAINKKRRQRKISFTFGIRFNNPGGLDTKRQQYDWRESEPRRVVLAGRKPEFSR